MTIGELKRLAAELSQVIQRLPEERTDGYNKNIVRPFEDALRELRTRVGNLEKAREPEAYFNPSNPSLFGIFAALALIGQDRVPMADIESYRFHGSGVYAIYYKGTFDAYERIAGTEHPIYVGKAKATTNGARNAREQGEKLWGRIREHKKSIGKVENLDIGDFECRFLVVHTGWETGAETALITLFEPLWNTETNICWGIGKHGDAASTRGNRRSPWDTLHPGRQWARDTLEDALTERQIRSRIDQHLGESPPIEQVDDILHRLMSEVRAIG